MRLVMIQKSYMFLFVIYTSILLPAFEYSLGESVSKNLLKRTTALYKKDESNNVNAEMSKIDSADILHARQFFQDIFMEHLAPLKIQFGHVCENPNEWEQRFEERDFDENRHQGKVKWGDKNGQYGEQYWDLNH